ncbi:porin [Actimicrobium antarcticum]|uniref:Porin n=1 Tax=Actimicrobium antarcticum TaxID=1051899 RepID=A0ABP7SPS2_9BURK
MKKLFVVAVAALASATSAQAVDLKAGDWTVSVGGIVNAYYTQVSCSGDTVGGLALGGRALGCGGRGDRTTIGNGLLPSGLITSVKSKQGEYDVAATIGIMTATASDTAVGNNSNVDVRQGFFSFGNEQMGTVKLGRDYGIFGANAILNDMTLVGAGAPVRATQANRVTLGHIGAGYSYLGTYGMMAYSSPASNGVKVDVALVSPVTNGPLGTGYDSGSTPQVQGQVSFGGSGAKVWLGAKGQKFEGTTLAYPSFTMRGVELGASYSAGPLGVLANVQTGTGLGIVSDADQGDNKSTNYFLQGTYKATDKVKVGLNYGLSKNKDNTTGTGGLESNSNVTGGVYFSITPAITLAAELGQTRSKGFNGGTAKMNGASFGGILFF